MIARRLESGRASFLFGFSLFGLWANVHAAFPVGLALYGAYFLGARFQRGLKRKDLGAEACGALLGGLLNPAGIHIYSVIALHCIDPVGRFIGEWGPVNWRMGFHLPRIAALCVGAALAWTARRESPAMSLCAAVLGAATAISSRFGLYFAVAAVGCLSAVSVRPKASWAAAGLVIASILVGTATRGMEWGAVFSDVYVARRAVDFIVSQREVFAPLRLFNTYEWGGYLGWRLWPDGKVYGDGRYLFHHQLPELQQALSGPKPFQDFIARNRLDAILIRAYPERLPTTRLYPDGSRREMMRPWYLSYLPRERWALVWWDDKAMVFVDRTKAPSPWLYAREYRLWRPGDFEALSDALARGEIDSVSLEAEKQRQRAESGR